MTPFEQRWEELRPCPGEPVFQRVDEHHKLDFYLGRDVTGERVLLLIANQEPSVLLPQSQAINLSVAKRSDGRWAVLFRLIRSDLGLIFSQLCEDLVESSRNVRDESEGIPFVLTRFLRWQRLLALGHTGLMDEVALRGLIGELICMEQIAFPHYGTKQSVQSWLGPSAYPKDFLFPDLWYEVKAVKPGLTTVTISSVEQLEGENRDGELVVIYLQKVSGSEPGSFTPAELVRRIKERLALEPPSIMEFEDKLSDAGYIERPEYQEQYYIIKNIRRFLVADGFPRICRSIVPDGIRNATYELEISSLLQFER